jgi:hypothetical protein
MKLPTIECLACGTLIELFPGDPGIEALGWNGCAEPPLRRCHHARVLASRHRDHDADEDVQNE